MSRRSLIIGFSLLALALAAVIAAWQGWREEQTNTVVAGAPAAPDVSHWPAEFGRRLQTEEAAVRQGPAPAAALGRLAVLYFANNFSSEAARALGVLRDLEPKQARWPYLAANLRQQLGDRPGTESALRDATALDPGYAPAWLRLGDLLVERESFAEAEQCYMRAIAIAPESVRAKFSLLLFEAYHNPHFDSRPAFQELVAAHPGIKPLHELLARLDEAAGDTLGAVGQDRLAAVAPHTLPREDPWLDALFSDCYDPKQLDLLADELAHEGRYDEAAARIERAIQLAPTAPALRESLARVRVAQNRPEEALAIMRAAVADHPDDPGLREKLAMMLRAGQRYDEAHTVILDALARWPQRASLYVELGQILGAAGQPQPALTALREAVRLDPTQAEAHYALGQSLLAVGHREEAAAAARQALKIRPAYPEPLALVAHLAIEDNDASAAETPVAQLLALRPHDADAQRLFATLQLMHGTALRKSGYLPGVEQEFLAGLKVCPDSLPLLRAHGLLVRDDGRLEEAHHWFAQGLRAATAAGDQAQVEEFKKLLGP